MLDRGGHLIKKVTELGLRLYSSTPGALLFVLCHLTGLKVVLGSFVPPFKTPRSYQPHIDTYKNIGRNLVTSFCILCNWDQLIQYWIFVEGGGNSWLLFREGFQLLVWWERAWDSLMPLGVGKQKEARENIIVPRCWTNECFLVYCECN